MVKNMFVSDDKENSSLKCTMTFSSCQVRYFYSLAVFLLFISFCQSSDEEQNEAKNFFEGAKSVKMFGSDMRPARPQSASFSDRYEDSHSSLSQKPNSFLPQHSKPSATANSNRLDDTENSDKNPVGKNQLQYQQIERHSGVLVKSLKAPASSQYEPYVHSIENRSEMRPNGLSSYYAPIRHSDRNGQDSNDYSSKHFQLKSFSDQAEHEMGSGRLKNSALTRLTASGSSHVPDSAPMHLSDSASSRPVVSLLPGSNSRRLTDSGSRRLSATNVLHISGSDAIRHSGSNAMFLVGSSRISGSSSTLHSGLSSSHVPDSVTPRLSGLGKPEDLMKTPLKSSMKTTSADLRLDTSSANGDRNRQTRSKALVRKNSQLVNDDHRHFDDSGDDEDSVDPNEEFKNSEYFTFYH